MPTSIYQEIARSIYAKQPKQIREPLQTEDSNFGIVFGFHNQSERIGWIENQIIKRVQSWCDSHEIDPPLGGLAQFESLPETDGAIGIYNFYDPADNTLMLSVAFRVVYGFLIADDSINVLDLIYQYFMPNQQITIPEWPSDTK